MTKETEQKDELLNTVKKNGTKDFFDSLIVAFVIAMIIRTFIISAYKIPSGSMLETLQIGDHILASKISYIIGKPKFGDVAVFEFPVEPQMDYIKRVMGVPGDSIRIKDKAVYRNGELLSEEYVRLSGSDSYLSYKGDNVDEFKVPEGMYFVMGDNRDSSYDGRFWGFVPEDSFKGKALFIYWSKLPGGEIRWKRIFNGVK